MIMEKELEKRTCPDLQVYMDERWLENPCKFLGSCLIIEESLTDSQAFWLQPNAFVRCFVDWNQFRIWFIQRNNKSLRFIFVHQGLAFCLCEDFNCFFDGWFLCIFKFILFFFSYKMALQTIRLPFFSVGFERTIDSFMKSLLQDDVILMNNHCVCWDVLQMLQRYMYHHFHVHESIVILEEFGISICGFCLGGACAFRWLVKLCFVHLL